MPQKIHFLGIGGAGISALARLSRNLGFEVSGCDQKDSTTLQALKSEGFKITLGHSPNHIHPRLDKIVLSSAVPWEIDEVQKAKELKVPILKRDSFCGELMQRRCGIGVAGTHGKTTTTSLITHLLKTAGLDPTFIVGGVLKNYQTNAGLGQGEYFVIEADEFDRMFLGLRPKIAIITNIEMDHPDCYGSFKEYKKAYLDYASLVPVLQGLLVGCGDDKNVQAIFKKLATAHFTYGFDPTNDFQVKIREIHGPRVVFSLTGSKFDFAEGFELQIPGEHNALNAAAAIIAAWHLNISIEEIKKACRSFLGAGRRFDVIGNINDILVVDDYAHHPTAVKVTIAAAKTYQRRLLVVYQPHQFARTAALLKNYQAVFNEADLTFLTQIYASRDKDTSLVDGQDLFKIVKEDLPKTSFYISHHDELVESVVRQAKKGDTILCMCVGNGESLTRKILSKLSSK